MQTFAKSLSGRSIGHISGIL